MNIVKYTFKAYGPADFATVGFELIPKSPNVPLVIFAAAVKNQFREGVFDAEFSCPVLQGVELAVRAHEQMGGHAIEALLLTCFEVWDAGTTGNGIVCAAAGAAWLTLGHCLKDVETKCINGCWVPRINGNTTCRTFPGHRK